jgi:hypothetical protein
MQSVPITTNVISSWRSVLETTCDKVCRYLRKFGGFLCVLRFPPEIKLTATISYFTHIFIDVFILSLYLSVVS